MSQHKSRFRREVLAIDASRNLSGGAVQYLINIIKYYPRVKDKFSAVHVWVHPLVLNELPSHTGIVFHKGRSFSLGKLGELVWQMFFLGIEARKYECNALVVLDSTYLGFPRPDVIVNQDLLAFDRVEVDKYPMSVRKLRLKVIRYVQEIAMKRAKFRIYLSEYARSLIESQIGFSDQDQVIPHGYETGRANFEPKVRDLSALKKRTYVSVSPVSRHKNYPQLLLGFAEHLGRFPSDRLIIIGGFPDRNLRHSLQAIIDSQPDLGPAIEFLGHVPHSYVSSYLQESDVFVFSSSCEACGVALIEGIESGLPMIVSNKSSIPEISGERAVYFNPYDPNSVARALSSFEALSESLQKPLSPVSQSWEARIREFWSLVGDAVRSEKVDS